MKHHYIKLALFTVFALVIISCSNAGNAPGTAGTSANSAFDSFKHNFRSTDLPMIVKACYVKEENYVKVTKEKYPLYIQTEDGYDLAAHTFKTNGDYTAVIMLCPADCYLPQLTTYDKNGKRIDEKIIGIGGCGADCGFTCEEYMIIRPDYSIYTSDTVTQFKCDTAGNEIPGTKEHYVIYKRGKLLNTGKIELSAEIKLELRD